MPFENFYKAADQYAHRWRLCLIAAIFLIAAYFTVPFFLMWLFEATPTPPTPAASEKSRLKANRLCRDLPKPERFFLVNTEERKTEDGSATVVYTYTSERGIDEIMPPLLIWLESEGWERVFDEVYKYREMPDQVHNFRYRNQRVSVLYFDLQKRDFNPPGQPQFQIVCTIEKAGVRD